MQVTYHRYFCDYTVVTCKTNIKFLHFIIFWDALSFFALNFVMSITDIIEIKAEIIRINIASSRKNRLIASDILTFTLSV